MALATKYSLAEQVQRMLGRDTGSSSRVHINEIILLIGQVASKLLKTEQFSVNMPSGETIPSNLVMHTYDSVDVVGYHGKSKSVLPFMPISLPKNMGVFQILPILRTPTESGYDYTVQIDEPLIPIPASMYGIIKGIDILGGLGGYDGYEIFGQDIVYTCNLNDKNVYSVMMRLIGVDVLSVSNFDILPLSADMQADVIQTVYGLLGGVPLKERVADGAN